MAAAPLVREGLSRAAVRGPGRLKFGIISDEVSEDFETALKWIHAQGLDWVELRNLWGTYVTDLEDRDVVRAKRLLERYGIRVSTVDTAFLKVTLPGSTALPNDQMTQPFGIYPYSEHDAVLLRGFEKARKFGTDKVRIFSFWRVSDPREIFEKVKLRLVRSVEMAEKARIRLLLENEHACNVGTGTELAEMLQAIPSRRLSGLWDPGNSFAGGEEPYPKGYSKLDKGRIRHMHLKDAIRDENGHRWTPVGQGQTDIRGQLSALSRDGYRDVISLETHYIPKDGSPADGSLESVRGLKRILDVLGV